MGRAEDLFDKIEKNGLAAIDELIETEKAEEHFLDFKRSADSGSGKRLHDNDRTSLERALSGFANSDGGVLVWGIGTSKHRGADLADSKFPLEDCVRFASLLDDAVSGCTVPQVPGVRSIPIKQDAGTRGFVATIIPQSAEAPHQQVHGGVYLIRAGTSFQSVTHGVLAGMFGRPLRPKLYLNFGVDLPRPLTEDGVQYVDVPVTLMLANAGSVLVSDAYLTWIVNEPGGPEVAVLLPWVNAKNWTTDALDTQYGSCVSNPDYRIAPRGVTTVAKLIFRLAFRSPGPIDIELVYGCRSAPPETRRLQVSEDAVRDCLTEFDLVHRQGGGEQWDGREWCSRVLGLEQL